MGVDNGNGNEIVHEKESLILLVVVEGGVLNRM